jgi:heterodisulfide reductase subunit C2
MAEVSLATPLTLVAGPEPAEKRTIVEEVAARTAGVSRLEMCIQCGSCGGSCPSAAAMDHTPRMLFAMLRGGLREEALRSNTFWLCVSCYHCVVRCPQNIHITDVMYALKSMAIEEGLSRNSTAPDLSNTFVGMVENFGRSFELGLASVHYLKHFPLRLPSLTPMALGLLGRKRMSLLPKKIKHLDQLRAILKRAKELEAAQ